MQQRGRAPRPGSMAARDILTLNTPIASRLIRCLYIVALVLITVLVTLGLIRGIRVMTFSPPPRPAIANAQGTAPACSCARWRRAPAATARLQDRAASASSASMRAVSAGPSVPSASAAIRCWAVSGSSLAHSCGASSRFWWCGYWRKSAWPFWRCRDDRRLSPHVSPSDSKHPAFIVALASLLALPATAQPANPPAPSTERVIVTAPRLNEKVTPNAIAHDFVKSFAAPTVLRGMPFPAGRSPSVRILTRGLAPQYVDVMEARLRTIAGEAGVPMKPKRVTSPTFRSSSPPGRRTYLDALRARRTLEVFLGYHGSKPPSAIPFGAWYVTGTRDNLTERVFLDTERHLRPGHLRPYVSQAPPRIASTNSLSQ